VNDNTSLTGIAGFRAKFGIDRSRLASLLGVGYSAIYRWERDETILKGVLAVKLGLLNKLLSSDRAWLLAADEEIRAEAYKSPAKKD
jgi:hypothetical protein